MNFVALIPNSHSKQIFFLMLTQNIVDIENLLGDSVLLRIYIMLFHTHYIAPPWITYSLQCAVFTILLFLVDHFQLKNTLQTKKKKPLKVSDIQNHLQVAKILRNVYDSYHNFNT